MAHIATASADAVLQQQLLGGSCCRMICPGPAPDASSRTLLWVSVLDAAGPYPERPEDIAADGHDGRGEGPRVAMALDSRLRQSPVLASVITTMMPCSEMQLRQCFSQSIG